MSTEEPQKGALDRLLVDSLEPAISVALFDSLSKYYQHSFKEYLHIATKRCRAMLRDNDRVFF
jgi:hypothetical protein